MNERLAAAFRVLPDYLGHHVALCAAALALGIVLSLPLALVASRSARLRWPLLTVVSLVQTIPSLALLALFYPILLVLSALSQRVFGAGFPALGFLPALAALTLYSMLPILRNGVTGLLNLDPAVIEAARGVGMSGRQRLFRVELPLAAPVLMAGIRTAAVWVIGTATLATPVGQTCLGNYIFAGLQTEDWTAVLFGCISAALLALAVDQLLALIEAGAARRSAWRVALGGAGLVAGALAATVSLMAAGPPAYRIGAKNFTEQHILAHLVADRLTQAGDAVSQRTGLGSAVIFRALAADEIDAYVDYSGTIWADFMHRTDHPDRATMLREMGDWLRREYGIVLLGPLGFENAYALAMRRDRAAALGIRSIADLAVRAPSLRLGTDYEFPVRPEWAALRAAYGLRFASSRQYQSTFMYQAVVDGTVDVISAFSSDGRVAADDLVVLSDPRAIIPRYDAVLLIAPQRAADAAFRRVLQPLVGAIDIDVMRQANQMVDRAHDKRTPAEAARFLAARAGLR
jgi:osmoprotectant transport system permease protein